MIKCVAGTSCAVSTYAEHGAFFDCAISVQRNERSRVNRA